MTYADFKDKVMLSMEDICRDIFRENRAAIKVKKEAVVVKNLVNIYNATLSLSNKKGFHSMSLRELARETNLSLGALYSYFSNKEQLLAVIQEQGYRITGKLLEEEIGKKTEPVEKLDIAIRTHLYLSEAMQPWFYFFFMEAKNLNKEEQKKVIASELYTEKVFADILAAGVTAGRFTTGNTLLAASLIKTLLQDWYLKRWKYTKRKISVDEYADFVVKFVERALGVVIK
ncbi:MAG: TetR/AcrR family transcriptional regulator [Thermodesulfobacteriota bacterium]